MHGYPSGSNVAPSPTDSLFTPILKRTGVSLLLVEQVSTTEEYHGHMDNDGCVYRYSIRFPSEVCKLGVFTPQDDGALLLLASCASFLELCDITYVAWITHQAICDISQGLVEMTTAMVSTIALALVTWSMICGVVVQAQDFDFFYFVQQWPGSYCDTRRGCCYPISSNPKPVFGIHGLWPNYNDGSWPASCGPEPFNPKEVADVLDKMDDDWGSLACPSSDSHIFWKHEWTKHGTCSGLTQHRYFQSAIDLYSKYDITGALAKAGIVPDGKHYQIDAIRHAISTVLDGHLPGVDCNKDGHGNRQLYQVYICVAKDGSTLIECPIFPRSECKGSVEFPVSDPHHHRLMLNDVDATSVKSDV